MQIITTSRAQGEGSSPHGAQLEAHLPSVEEIKQSILQQQQQQQQQNHTELSPHTS